MEHKFQIGEEVYYQPRNATATGRLYIGRIVDQITLEDFTGETNIFGKEIMRKFPAYKIVSVQAKNPKKKFIHHLRETDVYPLDTINQSISGTKNQHQEKEIRETFRQIVKLLFLLSDAVNTRDEYQVRNEAVQSQIYQKNTQQIIKALQEGRTTTNEDREELERLADELFKDIEPLYEKYEDRMSDAVDILDKLVDKFERNAVED